MKRNLSAILIVFLFPLNAISQIAFEKGYFVDNDGKRVECFIRNLDWKNNPRQIEYKLTQESQPQRLEIASSREFGVDDYSRFVRKTVRMDLSSEYLDSLRAERNPIWSEQKLFLKVLVEGKATLYFYQGGNIVRFFYEVKGSAVQQLIYKRYRTDDVDQVAVNNDFRQQLWSDLRCGETGQNAMRNVQYNSGDLMRYFRKYNECNGEKTVDQKVIKKKEFFNLKVKIGADYSSLTLIDPGIENVGLGSHLSPRLGLESEFILPFNKNKWSIVIEPTYQSYTGSSNLSSHGTAAGKYRSIELPFGGRYYFFLKGSNKLFLNAFIVADIPVGSDIRFQDNLYLGTLAGFAAAFGGGFSTGRTTIEMRYYTSRDIVDPVSGWLSDFHKISFILGYKLF